MGALDDLIYGVRDVFLDTVQLARRAGLVFDGADFDAYDDDVLGRTRVRIKGGAGLGGAPLVDATTGNTHNRPTKDANDLEVSNVVHTGAAPTVTGYRDGFDNRRILIRARIGPVILANENAGSDEGNRIVTGTGGNVTIPIGAAAWLVYDSTTARWHLAQIVGGAASSPTGTGFAHVTAGAFDAAATANMAYSGGGLVFTDAGFQTFGATNPASAGTQRFRNIVSAKFRKVSLGGDLVIFETNASDQLNIGQKDDGTEQVASIRQYVSNGGTQFFGHGSTTQLALNSSGVTMWAGGPLIFGHPGLSPAGIGSLRFPYAAADTVIGAKDSTGNDRSILKRYAADSWQLGDETNFNGAIYFSALQLWGKSDITIYAGAAGSSVALRSNGTATEVGLPIIGHQATSSPFSVHGGIQHVHLADTNYTLVAADYKYNWFHFSSAAWTVPHTLTLPHPASKALGYYITIFQQTGQTATISTGTGTTKTLGTGLARRFWIDDNGVSDAGVDFTP